MEKYKKGYLIAWGIAVAAFVGTAILIPQKIGGWSKSGSSFWAAFVMILLTFLGQLGCSTLIFRKANPQQRFLQLPIIYVSYIALFFTLIVEIICTVMPGIKNWLGFAIGFVILACYGIAVVMAVSGAEAIDKKEQKLKEDTRFLYSLRTEAELLQKQAQGSEAVTWAKKVSEAIRYSDPVSSAALEELEGRLYVAFSDLSKAVKEGDGNLCKEKAETFLALLEERNSKCKLLK